MDADAVQEILSEWGISAPVTGETVGNHKETWRVGTTHWPSGIPQAQESHFGHIQTLLDQPQLQDYRTPQAIPTLAGQGYTTSQEKIWYLTPHIPGRHPRPTSHTDMKKIAAAIARLHQKLKTIPAQKAISGPEPLQPLQAAAHLLATRKLPYSTDEYDTLTQGLQYLEDHPVCTQHAQLIHGDPSYPNLKLDHDSNLTGILDWDSTTTASPVYDLAVIAQTILYRSNTDSPQQWLDDLLQTYSHSGGHQYSRHQLLSAVLSIKYESINHHGQNYLDSGCTFDLTYSQVAKIHTALTLARRG